MREKYRITKESITIVGGICFILFALVTLFSQGTPFKFLSDIISHSFGFVGFWILLPYFVILGFYLIFRGRFIKLKLGVSLWGFLIIILMLLILCSHWASWNTVFEGVKITGKGHTPEGSAKYLTFSNSISIFNQIASEVTYKFGPSTKLGGGKIGFIFAGAINSAISPVGLNILCWVLFTGALIMVFNVQFVHFVKFIKRRKNKEPEEDVFKEVAISTQEVEPEIAKQESVEPEIEEPKKEEVQTYDNRPIFESFHTSNSISNEYDLKKAHFVPKGEEKTEEIQEQVITKPTFSVLPKDQDEENEVSEEISDFEEQNVEEIKETESEEIFKEKVEEAFEDEPVKEEEQEIPYENRPQPKANLVKNYIYPGIDLLNQPDNENDKNINEESCAERTEIINTAFKNLGIGAEVVSYTVGPSVTRFDVQTHADSTVTAIQKYITDISIRLNGASVRFEAIVAGKSTSGLEIPNEHRIPVSIREVIEELPKGNGNNLVIPFGKDISGELKYANLAEFPHMLIAGCTGSGKSIFVHSVIISLLMKNKPEELKLILIDPKKVEMSYYEEIPHLLCPVICEMQKVYVCFTKLINEMERRYNLFKSNKVRDIKGFNAYAKTVNLQPLPYIVVFIDEYADLVENVKNIKELVLRLVQKARAAGIHMVFATQRPSVDVVDGTIKANVSTRIALSCASNTDSQTVLDTAGAEKLLGNGDMLISCPLISRTMKPRAQGCYVSEVEINRVCNFLKEHYQTQYDPMFLNLDPVVEKKPLEEVEATPIDKTKSDDEIYEKIKSDASHREYFSISHITRTYGMGFTRAGKIFYRLQAEGIVSTSGDARGCKVLTYVPGGQQEGSVEQSTFIPDGNDENNN